MGSSNYLLEVVRLLDEEGLDMGQLLLQTYSSGNITHPTSDFHAMFHECTNELAGQPRLPKSNGSCKRIIHTGTEVGSKLIPGGPCQCCGCGESPQWRRPGDGTMLLCNRCGVHLIRYKKLPDAKKDMSSNLEPTTGKDEQVGCKRKPSATGHCSNASSSKRSSQQSAPSPKQMGHGTAASHAAVSEPSCGPPPERSRHRHPQTSRYAPAGSLPDVGMPNLPQGSKPAAAQHPPLNRAGNDTTAAGNLATHTSHTSQTATGSHSEACPPGEDQDSVSSCGTGFRSAPQSGECSAKEAQQQQRTELCRPLGKGVNAEAGGSLGSPSGAQCGLQASDLVLHIAKRRSKGPPIKVPATVIEGM